MRRLGPPGRAPSTHIQAPPPPPGKLHFKIRYRRACLEKLRPLTSRHPTPSRRVPCLRPHLHGQKHGHHPRLHRPLQGDQRRRRRHAVRRPLPRPQNRRARVLPLHLRGGPHPAGVGSLRGPPRGHGTPHARLDAPFGGHIQAHQPHMCRSRSQVRVPGCTVWWAHPGAPTHSLVLFDRCARASRHACLPRWPHTRPTLTHTSLCPHPRSPIPHYVPQVAPAGLREATFRCLGQSDRHLFAGTTAASVMVFRCALLDAMETATAAHIQA